MNDRERWIKTAREKGAIAVLGVWDKFDESSFPVYVMPDDDIEKIKSKNETDFLKVIETIEIDHDDYKDFRFV